MRAVLSSTRFPGGSTRNILPFRCFWRSRALLASSQAITRYILLHRLIVFWVWWLSPQPCYSSWPQESLVTIWEASSRHQGIKRQVHSEANVPLCFHNSARSSSCFMAAQINTIPMQRRSRSSDVKKWRCRASGKIIDIFWFKNSGTYSDVWIWHAASRSIKS